MNAYCDIMFLQIMEDKVLLFSTSLVPMINFIKMKYKRNSSDCVILLRLRVAVIWLNDVSSSKTIGRMDFIYSNRLNVQLAKHMF